MKHRRHKQKAHSVYAISVIIASAFMGIGSFEISAGNFQGREVKDFKRGKTESESADKKIEARHNAEKKGVLGILSGKIKGKDVASADIFIYDEFTSEIDAILLNVGNLKPAGSERTQRKGATGIGFNVQDELMSVNNIEDVDDLVGSIINSDVRYMSLKIRDPLKFESSLSRGGESLASERNRSNILLSIIKNLPGIRYTYGRRLKEKSRLKGSITVRFAIDEFGKVIFCSVVNSTISDPVFERRIVRKIKQWKFKKIKKSGDVSEVVYTFVFS